MQLIQKVHDYFLGLYLAYERRRVLNRQLEGLADDGLLDRAAAGSDKL